MTDAPTWQEETKSLWHALDGNIEELTERLDALEARLPKPTQVIEPMRLTCAQCTGPVEPERNCYAHPTCYRCLPPPEPLPAGAVTPRSVALPDYLLAPTPDYRSELPAEIEPCGCDESFALRAEVARLRAELARRDGR